MVYWGMNCKSYCLYIINVGTAESSIQFNPLKAELNPICYWLALLGVATIVVVSRLRVNLRNG